MTTRRDNGSGRERAAELQVSPGDASGRLQRPQGASQGRQGDGALDWVTPHKFRHSLATELQQHGYDATTIAAVLGHTDPAFTARVYIHAKDAPRFDDLAVPMIEAGGA